MAIVRIWLVAALLIGGAAAAPAADLSPVGVWRTMDDAGRETGAVRIYRRDGVLDGDITAIVDPAKRAALCVSCTDDRKDRPVLGMQVLRGLRADGEAWDGGEIVDPQTGRVYRVKAHMTDGGEKLVLRGYLGISLFGRTQIWQRAAP